MPSWSQGESGNHQEPKLAAPGAGGRVENTQRRRERSKVGRTCGPRNAEPQAVQPESSALTTLGFSLLVCEPGLLCILNWRLLVNMCISAPRAPVELGAG